MCVSIKFYVEGRVYHNQIDRYTKKETAKTNGTDLMPRQEATQYPDV